MFSLVFHYLFPWVALINKTPLKCKCLISDEKHVSPQMKTWWCFTNVPGVSLGIKIHPPDPNGCHLLAFDCLIMNNWWVWKVICQKRQAWFHLISRHREVGWKMRRSWVFKDQLRGAQVWMSDEILTGVFDVAFHQMNYHKWSTKRSTFTENNLINVNKHRRGTNLGIFTY